MSYRELSKAEVLLDELASKASLERLCDSGMRYNDPKANINLRLKPGAIIEKLSEEQIEILKDLKL